MAGYQRYTIFSDRIGAVGDNSKDIKYPYSEIVEKEGKGGSPSVVIQRAGASTESDADRAYEEFGILKRERVNAEGENDGTQVDIQCKIIQDALRLVFGMNYPGGIHSNPIVFRKPYYPLFHNRHKIRKLVRESNSYEQKQRLKWLTDFMDLNFTTLEKLQLGFVDKGWIEFKHLPLIFETGSIVVGVIQRELDQTVRFDEPLETEKPECFLFLDISDDLEDKTKGGKYIELNVLRWGFDGSKYGPTKVRLRIKEFPSLKSIAGLECYPLSQLEPGERNSMVLELIERGKRWCDYVKAKNFKYEGVGHAMTRADWAWDVKKSTKNMSGRVILDHPSFMDAYPELVTPLYEGAGAKTKSAPPASQEPLVSAEIWKISDNIIPWDGLWEQERDGDGNYVPSDAQALLCPAVSLGYSLATKKWGLFDVNRLRPMDWARHRINELEIKHQQKRLLNDLISGYYSGRPAGEEVAGKDDGLIFLLHGPPGCGKTLTAELMAEGFERALIRITFADLGERLGKIEMNLVALFKLAVRSGAMVLIDEADAFLAKRQANSGGNVDHNHNAIVSIFLRQLECFNGIMFLTTNRGTSIDQAISSRVIPLKYPPLGAESKAKIWMGQLLKERGDRSEEEIGLMCKELAAAYPNLDGREIKKLARLASTVSRGRKKVVSRDVIGEIYELAHRLEESTPNP